MADDEPLDLAKNRSRIDRLKADAEEIYKGTPFFNGSATTGNGSRSTDVRVRVSPVPKVFEQTDKELRELEERKRAEAEAGKLLWFDTWKADPRIYLPTPDNRPAPVSPLLKLHGSVIGSIGNLSMIVADPGSGKSAIQEAICARAINPLADAFGLSVHSHKKVLYVDTERSDPDHWVSLDRMLRRADASQSHVHADIVLYANFRSVETIDERQQLLWPAIESGAFDLVLIDGAADFVHDPNDLAESSAIVTRLSAIANQQKLHIQCTLHQNPGDNRKPRGHIGSELQRKCESVLVLERDPGASQRTLTMDVRYGKNRSGRDDLKTFFDWDKESQMFTTCADGNIGIRPGARQKARGEWEEYVEEAFALMAEQPRITLADHLATISGKSRGTCQNRIADLVAWGLIEKLPSQRYCQGRGIGSAGSESLNENANDLPEFNNDPF